MIPDCHKPAKTATDLLRFAFFLNQGASKYAFEISGMPVERYWISKRIKRKTL